MVQRNLQKISACFDGSKYRKTQGIKSKTSMKVVLLNTYTTSPSLIQWFKRNLQMIGA